MRRVSLTALVVFLIGVRASGYATNQLRANNSRNSDKRLRAQGQQMTTLFTSVANTIQTVLATGSAVAEATNGSKVAFRRSVRRPLEDTPLLTNAVLLDLAGGKVKIADVVGRPPVLLGGCEAACSAAVRRLDRSGRLDIVTSDTKQGVRILGLANVAHPGSSTSSIPRSLFRKRSQGSRAAPSSTPST
jgi:hypothetical protein